MGADDAWALQIILKAEKLLKSVKVLPITTVFGTTSTIRIYKGATEGFIPVDPKMGQFYGRNGFSDIHFWQLHYPNNANEVIQQKNVVEIIREMVMAEWRFNVMGNVDCVNVRLLNEVERIAYSNNRFYTPYDAFSAAAFIFLDTCIQYQRTYNATLELQGQRTRGQMVFDRGNNNHNVNIIATVNEDEIKKILQWTASS
ncbi:uncharacterized protein LOC129565602 [Sitodiplosis mosellana]|uniref:uncharacterized protein LOC129565602 n=1 Tax=Sitodiplosis mosellana TaxID=263140 RepID=UPI0024444477|nr:uncharacterized protein LOC129565602 [Sitodiplosis mosellana]